MWLTVELARLYLEGDIAPAREDGFHFAELVRIPCARRLGQSTWSCSALRELCFPSPVTKTVREGSWDDKVSSHGAVLKQIGCPRTYRSLCSGHLLRMWVGLSPTLGQTAQTCLTRSGDAHSPDHICPCPETRRPNTQRCQASRSTATASSTTMAMQRDTRTRPSPTCGRQRQPSTPRRPSERGPRTARFNDAKAHIRILQSRK